MNKNKIDVYSRCSTHHRTLTQYVNSQMSRKGTIETLNNQYLRNRMQKINILKSKRSTIYAVNKRKTKSHLEDYGNKTTYNNKINTFDIANFEKQKNKKTIQLFTPKINQTLKVKSYTDDKTKIKQDIKRTSVTNIINQKVKIRRTTKSLKDERKIVLMPEKSQLGELKIISQQPKQKSNKFEYQAKMKQVSKLFNEEKLYARLSKYSKQILKHNVRVYKEDFENILNNRYGNSRILSFLGIQYIQDFYSIKQTIQQILRFNQQQMLLFCFLIINQNRDGLIGPDDLISFLGIHKQNSTINSLIMKDLYTITEYLKKKQQLNLSIMDEPSYQYDFLLDEGLTLMKYKIILHKRKKKKQEAHHRRNKIISGRMRQYLYTLRNQDQEEPKRITKKLKTQINNIISYSLNLKTNNLKKQQNNQNLQRNFAINFLSFKQIFESKIPQLFFDFLFVLGGLQIFQQNYTQINFQCLEENLYVEPVAQQQKKITKMKKMIQNMKSVNQFAQFVLKQLVKI